MLIAEKQTSGDPMISSAATRAVRSSDEKSHRREIPKEHRLKCWPEFFEAIKNGRKTHDLRRADDRDFEVGDRLLLKEFDPGRNEYTGRTLAVRVTYVTSGDLPCALSREALDPRYCILSIALER